MTGPQPNPINLYVDLPTGPDIMGKVRASGWKTMRGTQQQLPTGMCADAGSWQGLLDNTDSAFDPNNIGGPYYPDLTRGRLALQSCFWSPTTYSVFFGRVDDWPQNYPMNGRDSTVNLKINDAVAKLSRCQITTQRDPEYTGERVAAILAMAGFTESSVVARGNRMVGKLAYGTVSAWSHLQQVAQVEWGMLYIDADGTLVFRSLGEVVTDARSSTSQATYTDQTEAVTPGGLRYIDAQLQSLPIINDCTLTWSDNGDEVNAQDAASIASEWGLYSQPLSLPLDTGTSALQYVNWLISRYKDPLQSFSSVTFAPADPDLAAVLYPEVLGRKIGDRVTITRTPPNGVAIVRDVLINGISHSYSDNNWKSSTFYVQDASWMDGIFVIDRDHMDSGSGSTNHMVF